MRRIRKTEFRGNTKKKSIVNFVTGKIKQPKQMIIKQIIREKKR